MSSSSIPCLCRIATTFAADGSLDEEAQASLLERLAREGIGFYLGSGGSGEGHALSIGEHARILAIGREVGQGKVSVNANPPEQYSVEKTIALANVAMAEKADCINLYAPAGLHGYKASRDEIMYFFDRVLTAVRYPVALGPGPVIGYSPEASTIADICNRHTQVVAVNLAGLGHGYFVELRDALKRDVDIYVPYAGSLNLMALGAKGLLGPEANIIPQSFRRYIEGLASGDRESLRAYADIHRFALFVKPWHSGSPRWIKLAMRALGLSGGHLREPYRMPNDAAIDAFARDLLALSLPDFAI